MNHFDALSAFSAAAKRYNERGARCAYLDKLGPTAKLPDVFEDLGTKVELRELYPTWGHWRGSYLAPVESVHESYRVQDRWNGEIGLRWISLLDHVLKNVSLSNGVVYSAAFGGSMVTEALFTPIRRK